MSCMALVTRFGSYPDVFAKYVRPTRMADFDVAFVKKQANILAQEAKTDYQAIKLAHEFVAHLPIGFDRETSPASVILKKGRGQCITKTTLFVALLRGIGVPCRVHGWRVHKIVHKKRMPALVYAFSPKTTLFTYPEVYYKDTWMLLSEALVTKGEPDWNVCPFDNAIARKHPLKPEWIAEDLGVFWHPDTFVEQHGTNHGGWRNLAFPIAQFLLNK